MSQITPYVKNIIIINVVLWLATILLLQYNIYNLNDLLALHFFQSKDYGIWQFLTYMFMHGTFYADGQIFLMHILFNMFAVWMFGSPLERAWGSNKFLFFYISAGLGAAMIHFLASYLQYDAYSAEILLGQMVGASGAVYGILVAFAFMYPNSQLMLIFLPVPIKAKYFVPLIIAGDLFFGFSNASTGVAHFAHIGGALIGFVMMWYWKKNQFNQDRWDN